MKPLSLRLQKVTAGEKAKFQLLPKNQLEMDWDFCEDNKLYPRNKSKKISGTFLVIY